MAVRMFCARDRRPTAWKNGGGVTRQIAAHPPGADLSSFDWRVSLATVSVGGPFSIFSGVDRSLSVLEGELFLRIAGRGRLGLTATSAPASFPGDVAAWSETPTRPVSDLNVMTRRGRIQARVDRVRVEAAHHFVASDRTLVFTPSAGLELAHAGGAWRLAAADALLIEGESGKRFRLKFDRSGDVFIIRFEAAPRAPPSPGLDLPARLG